MGEIDAQGFLGTFFSGAFDVEGLPIQHKGRIIDHGTNFMAIGRRTIIASLDGYAIHIADGFMTFYESILQNGICRRDCEVYSANIAFKAQIPMALADRPGKRISSSAEDSSRE